MLKKLTCLWTEDSTTKNKLMSGGNYDDFNRFSYGGFRLSLVHLLSGKAYPIILNPVIKN
ncbi:unknown protein [Microcystis aeruginosa NIES-843]|jgi:hypothetical protein|uniref:Uncharacterized protein n=1 Tax=Microcystis aeruginosa (strain NIES-843 / IAM M-2473) TaxID=449447 RepID=B0JU92_MICAN|nr:unknown protein [Microcystis aeruginosa NIES-843]